MKNFKKLISTMLSIALLCTTFSSRAFARGIDKIEYGKDGWKTVYVSSENIDAFLQYVSEASEVGKCYEKAKTLKPKDVFTTLAPVVFPLLTNLGSYKVIKKINSKIFEPNKVKADIQKIGKTSYLIKSMLIAIAEIAAAGLLNSISFIFGWYIFQKNTMLNQIFKCDDLAAEYKCIYNAFYPNYDHMKSTPTFLDITKERDQNKIRLMRANGMKATLNGLQCHMGAVEPQSWDEQPEESL